MSTFVILTDGTAIASVTITVNDVNEAPSFTLSSYSGEISENSAHGVDIITIFAVDPDGSDTLTYNLSGSGELKNKVGYIDELRLTLKKICSTCATSCPYGYRCHTEAYPVASLLEMKSSLHLT